MQPSTMLIRRMPYLVNWMIACFSVMKFFMSLDVSLSNLWSWGW